MRIINDTNLIKLPDDSTCRFFVQIWYSMVHRNSLDSHRVRSMNSLNILRELGDLISKEDLPNILDDIKRAAEEALDIMQKDKIISLHFKGLLERIKPLLEEIIKASKSKGIKDSPSFFMLRYLTRDFTTDLIQRYKHCIIEELEKSIFKTKSEDNIFAYTGTLLSVLIDEGHSIEELFGFAKNIFVERRGDTAYAFEKSFNFMKRLIDHPDYEYDIIFRLEGFKKKELVPSIIGDVEFLEIFTIESDERVSAFLSPGLNVLLGKTRVKAQDDRSAGAIAKKKLDDILDLIRFEMEHEIITVSQEFVSLRLSNSSSRVFKLPSQIPNPNKNITAEEFEQFVKSISEVLDSKTIHRESKERIKSAIRFY